MSAAPLDAVFDTVGETMALAGGERLLQSGSSPSALFRLRAGRLATLQTGDGVASQIVTVHRPGALLGGREILGGDPHAFTITALRDSEIDRVPRALIEAVLHAEPAVLADLARRVMMRKEGAHASRPRASLLGFVAVCDSIAMGVFVEKLAAALRSLHQRVAILDARVQQPTAVQLSALEDDHDLILLAAERREIAFAEFCGRQIDRLVLVGGIDSLLPEAPFRFAALALQRDRLVDLVLVHPPEAQRPRDARRWEAAASPARLFHVREASSPDIARLARVYSGRSVGIALSGGGARAFAHVGVIRAFAELGVPIDFIAGTSMGAVIGAGVASGWTPDELETRIEDAFGRSSPLQDIAFPILAMSGGRIVDRRLRTHFGDAEICDLWRPFACVSTNLTTGDACVHRSGFVRDAVRASISLPGVLPPVVVNGEVLVDGALVRNLPSGIVNALHDGPTIGVDVARVAGLQPDELMLKPPGWRWITSGAWRKGPPIVSVLIRSATMPTSRAMALARNDLDLVVEPDLQDIQLRDWKAYRPAVEAGYRAAMAKAETLAALVP